MGEMVEFPSQGHGPCDGYLALPAQPGPGVILIQEWWGLVPHIEEVADRFAGEGYVTLAPDLYHGAKTEEPDEAGKLLMAMKMERTARDMSGAVDYLLAHPSVAPKKIGAVGFCAGGGLALMLAAVKPIEAVVPFYPAFAHGEPDYSTVKGSVLIHGAEHDEWAAPEKVEQVTKELQAAGVDASFHIYPGTEHAFFNDSRAVVHQPAAAQQAWQRTLDFLGEKLR